MGLQSCRNSVFTNQVNHKAILLVCGFLKSFKWFYLVFNFYYLNDFCPDFSFLVGHETCAVFSSDDCWKSFCLLFVIVSDVLLVRKLRFGWLVFVTASERKPLI